MEEVKKGNNCFYIGESEVTPIGIMEYHYQSDKVLVVTHTFVSPEFRGRGLAKMLLDQLVAVAREKDLKIIPKCAYVRAVFEQSPKYLDVRYLEIS